MTKKGTKLIRKLKQNKERQIDKTKALIGLARFAGK